MNATAALRERLQFSTLCLDKPQETVAAKEKADCLRQIVLLMEETPQEAVAAKEKADCLRQIVLLTEEGHNASEHVHDAKQAASDARQAATKQNTTENIEIASKAKKDLEDKQKVLAVVEAKLNDLYETLAQIGAK